MLYLTVNEEELDYMNFKKFKDTLLGLKEIMEEIENTKVQCELKIQKPIKTARTKFRIEKEEELEWALLKVRTRFFEDLNKQEIEKIKVTIKNKEEIEEFSKNLKKIIELDQREIRYETNNLLCDLKMKKKINQMKQKQ